METRLRGRQWMAQWWAGEGGPLGRVLDVALAPAELLFRAGVSARNLAYDRGWLRFERAPVPVVGVGNLGVGGAGKTPVAAWIAARLRGWGMRPAVVLRGYGADEIQVHRELNPDLPVFAAPRRVDAARRAAAAGCDVVVLDDGFQHRALARDLDIVLVPVEGWSDRRRLLPRGPWREAAAALRRAGVVVVTRKSAPAEAGERVARDVGRVAPGVPLAGCWIAPVGLVPALADGPPRRRAPGGGPALAVAALADPRPFVEHLVALGFDVELAAYPDHHPFDAREAGALARRAGERPILMTHKDAVKLRSLLPSTADAWVLRQEVRFTSGEEALERALGAAVGRRGA
ncbi:MAG TPA: tetraacyldisaccharide 4'-kinase [Longimicrobiaceae bacterium]|nr:tetraacyldisaccharide 4'-kinase [Longimicrobiaceae bacterium]